MIKTKIQFLKHLISEIEITISNKECYYPNNNKNIQNNNTHDINYNELLNNGQLSQDLINELGYFIQVYGDELLYFINQNCPPMLLIEAISLFTYEKEKYKFESLRKELNYYIDLEDISGYRFADYLTLGYSFYDSLFFVYMNRYQIHRYNVWNLVSNTEYEKPQFLEQENNIASTSKTKVKNKPKPNKYDL
jgi:hypothetical protein